MKENYEKLEGKTQGIFYLGFEKSFEKISSNLFEYVTKKMNKFFIKPETSWKSPLKIFLRSLFSEDLQWRSASYLKIKFDNISSKNIAFE